MPVGTRVTLQAGQQAYITQSLGGSYTVVVNGNMFRLDGKDADALGLEVASKPAPAATTSRARPSSSRKKSGTRCGPVTILRSRSTSWTWD